MHNIQNTNVFPCLFVVIYSNLIYCQRHQEFKEKFKFEGIEKFIKIFDKVDKNKIIMQYY